MTKIQLNKIIDLETIQICFLLDENIRRNAEDYFTSDN